MNQNLDYIETLIPLTDTSCEYPGSGVRTRVLGLILPNPWNGLMHSPLRASFLLMDNHSWELELLFRTQGLCPADRKKRHHVCIRTHYLLCCEFTHPKTRVRRSWAVDYKVFMVRHKVRWALQIFQRTSQTLAQFDKTLILGCPSLLNAPSPQHHEDSVPILPVGEYYSVPIHEVPAAVRADDLERTNSRSRCCCRVVLSRIKSGGT